MNVAISNATNIKRKVRGVEILYDCHCRIIETERCGCSFSDLENILTKSLSKEELYFTNALVL